MSEKDSLCRCTALGQAKKVSKKGAFSGSNCKTVQTVDNKCIYCMFIFSFFIN